MPEQISLTIPELHPSLNEWAIKWHYRKRYREKKRWETMVGWIAKRTPPMIGTVDIVTTYYFPTKRARDRDNYAPKFIMDALVKAGIIEDDNCNVINDQRVVIDYDKKNPRTEVLITKVK